MLPFKQFFLFLFFGGYLVVPLAAQDPNPVAAARKMKSFSIEELMEMEVTSVSRAPEKLSEVASSIQVLTNEDIHRSAATRLPEALRLAPNLMVAQTSSHDWAITARGFNGAPLTNNSLSAKLLVMIDGRTVYTPLFGGVFWDVQNVLLEDIDKIEIISGPGGTLWGANAMNGVINVNTKSTRETQGLYLTGAAGNFLKDQFGARYGGKIGENLYYKVYTQHFDFDQTTIDEADGMDAWGMTQGGFRMDYYPSSKNQFTFQGDLYGGKENIDDGNMQDGQNVLARWSHRHSYKSNMILQLYYDRTWRTLPGREFIDQMQTYDLDFQHSLEVGERQRLVFGAGYRMMRSHIRNKADPQFFPVDQDMPLFQVFVQDEINLIKNKLDATVGIKLLHNFFSGYEWQPSGRLAWSMDENNTLWASISRAVRMPTRFDVDISSPAVATPGKRFASEKLIAYQIGHRLNFMKKGTLSTAVFYHDYTDLRSFNLNTGTPPPIFLFANDQLANSMGVEILANFYATERWRLRAGYTFLQTNFESENDLVFQPFSADFEAIDPKSQFLLHSILDLPGGFELDLVGRYVHRLKETFYNPAIPAYYTVNARIGWRYKAFELALMGQNLFEDDHREFSSRAIPRSLFGRISVRL